MLVITLLDINLIGMLNYDYRLFTVASTLFTLILTSIPHTQILTV